MDLSLAFSKVFILRANSKACLSALAIDLSFTFSIVFSLWANLKA
jgi:hypothetical protein